MAVCKKVYMHRKRAKIRAHSVMPPEVLVAAFVGVTWCESGPSAKFNVVDL